MVLLSWWVTVRFSSVSLLICHLSFPFSLRSAWPSLVFQGIGRRLVAQALFSAAPALTHLLGRTQSLIIRAHSETEKWDLMFFGNKFDGSIGAKKLSSVFSNFEHSTSEQVQAKVGAVFNVKLSATTLKIHHGAQCVTRSVSTKFVGDSVTDR